MKKTLHKIRIVLNHAGRLPFPRPNPTFWQWLYKDRTSISSAWEYANTVEQILNNQKVKS